MHSGKGYEDAFVSLPTTKNQFLQIKVFISQPRWKWDSLRPQSAISGCCYPAILLLQLISQLSLPVIISTLRNYIQQELPPFSRQPPADAVSNIYLADDSSES